MRILVTGNMGYVGPLVVRHLRERYPDAFLAGYDTGFFGNCLTTGGALPECVLDAQYYGDIRSFDADVLDGFDAVVHLAGISNDPIGNQFEDVTLEINHRATVSIAEKARAKGVRAFVFASSCSIYGAAEDAARREDSELNPLTAYARSKVLAEKGLEPLATDDFSVTCLRFSTACGMSDRLRLDLVLNDFVAAAIASGRILILSDGSPWRPLINVADMALAIEWAIERQQETGGRYLAINVGANHWNYQVRDLAHAVAEAIPNVEVDINADAVPDKRSYRVCFDLYEGLAPRHQPAHDLAGTIAGLKQGLESMGFADADFRNSGLMRLKVLEQLRAASAIDLELRWQSRAGNATR